MSANSKLLAEVLAARLRTSGPRAQDCVEQASEVIVFGSMSASLQRPDSDIDVLCVGGSDFKVKTKALDLIAVRAEETKRRAWLQSELVTHVTKYGTWVKGVQQWKSEFGIGVEVVREKRRRVSAFIRSLDVSWFRLEECFRVKYSTKLRRETQRLILLERDVPVPPTRVLDDLWVGVSDSPNDVCNRLQQFASEPCSSFINDLLLRIEAHFNGKQISC